MLNKVLMAKKDEVFTTVDLIEIDKLTGEATLVKAGAAPSYLLRGGDCTKLESRTLPAGIMPAVKAEQIKLRLRRGDCLVMLSDGITQNRSYTPAVSRPGSAKELVTAADAARVRADRVRGRYVGRRAAHLLESY